jgi:arginine decarboxylase
MFQKQQNDRENWYMINGSIMSSIPDIWGMDQKFIVLPLNKWNDKSEIVNIGGLSCDNEDYYNSEIHKKQLFLPKMKDGEELYIGFFHTGAYQDALAGYGGVKHCLIPAPKHIIINKDENGKLVHHQYRGEQMVEPMLEILGY